MMPAIIPLSVIILVILLVWTDSRFNEPPDDH